MYRKLRPNHASRNVASPTVYRFFIPVLKPELYMNFTRSRSRYCRFYRVLMQSVLYSRAKADNFIRHGSRFPFSETALAQTFCLWTPIGEGKVEAAGVINWWQQSQAEGSVATPAMPFPTGLKGQRTRAPVLPNLSCPLPFPTVMSYYPASACRLLLSIAGKIGAGCGRDREEFLCVCFIRSVYNLYQNFDSQ